MDQRGLIGRERRMNQDMDEIKWYGISNKDGNISYFRNIETDYVDIFLKLRKGIIPEIDKNVNKPDLRKAMIEFGKVRLKEELGEDRFVVKLVQALNSLDEIINLYYERASGFAIFTENFHSVETMNELFNTISEEYSKFNPAAMHLIGNEGKRLMDTKKELESLLNDSISRIMPNTSRLIGPNLASELLARAGSLQRLALSSASAIQLTGAERALFQHLSKGTDPPKHGIIYKHSLVAGAPDGKTGKRARRLACKICITARADLRGTHLSDDIINGYLSNIQKQ
jgi:nucleolar protein 56